MFFSIIDWIRVYSISNSFNLTIEQSIKRYLRNQEKWTES